MTLKALAYYFNSIFTLLSQIKNPGALFRLLQAPSSKYAAWINLKSGDTFLVSSLMDVWILKETAMDRQYEKAGMALQDGWTVVDIGAAFGDYSVWAARQMPHGRVIAVEPYPPSLALLRSNLERNHILNVDIFDGAIAASSGFADLKIRAGKAVQNSTTRKTPTDQEIAVQTIDLAGLFMRFEFERCDYLKMDCEGGEYEILFHSPHSIFTHIDRICMEIHDGIDGHTREEMMQFLDRTGYRVRLTPNPVHQKLAYLYAEKSDLTKGRL